jgi:tetratricopeptide (TPR) repeat protein
METRTRNVSEKQKRASFLRAGLAWAGTLAACIALGILLHTWMSSPPTAPERKGKTRVAAQARLPGGTDRQATAAGTTVTAESAAAPTAIADTQPLRVVSFAEAEHAYRQKTYTEAADLFTRFLEANPRHAWGYYMLGLSLWKSGRNDHAVDAFLATLEIDPDHVKSRVNLGRVFLDLGNPDEALPLLERAVEIAPEAVDAWRVLGRTYHSLGRRQEAIASYEQALRLDDRDAWSLNNLGLVLIEQEDFAEALAPLAKACVIRPEEPCFHNNLGVAFERTENYRAAIEAFTQALAADEEYEKARVSLARVQGRPDLPSESEMSVEELATRFPPEQPTPPVAGEEVALAGLADGDDAEVTPAGPEPAGEDETR